MGQKDLIKLGVAVVLLLVGVALVFMRGGGQSQTRGGAAPDSQYYYNVETGNLFAAAPNQASATDPAGGEGVRAFVYTCGECTESELLVGYIQKLSDKAIEAQAEIAGAEEDRVQALYNVVQQGTFVAEKPEGDAKPQWVSVSHPDGGKVAQSFQRLCKGKLALICTPDKVK